MEAMDSELFRIPELVDYRASLDTKLHVEAMCTASEGVVEEILDAVKRIYPHLEVAVSVEFSSLDHRPAYLGKRHIIQK